MPITPEDYDTFKKTLREDIVKVGGARAEIYMIREALSFGYQKAKAELEAEYAAKQAAYTQKVTDRLMDGEITVKFRPVFEVETS